MGEPTMPLRHCTPEVWSFFSGAMGLDLGLERAGLKSTLAVEIDDACVRTIRMNRPTLDVWQADVRDLSADQLRSRRSAAGDVFLMVGGPPCQSFSTAGKRAALSDPRGNLLYTYLRLIGKVRPQFFVLENVAHLVTAAIKHRPISQRPGKMWNLSAYHKGARTRGGGDDALPMSPDEMSGSAVRQVFADVTELGYSINFAILDAADYGAAQHRLRFVMLGSRDGPAATIPAADFGPTSPGGRPWRTVRDAIDALRDRPGAHSAYTEDVAKYFDLVPPGGNWRSLPKPLQREALGEASFEAGGGKTGFFRRLAWGRPAPTITGRANRKGSAMCHPDVTRPLSVRECARLQGFPDDWAFTGSMSDQYLQIGNAVPVELGAAIGRAIEEASMATPCTPAANTFDLMLARATERLRAAARNKRPAAKDVRQAGLFDVDLNRVGR